MTSLLKRTGVLCFLMLLLSCRTEEPDASSNASLIIYNEQLAPLQIATVGVSETELMDSEYYGDLAGQEVVFVKLNATTLSFVVPETIETGTQTIKVSIGDEMLEATVLITEGVEIADPQSVFDNYYEELTTSELYSGINVQALDEAMAKFKALSAEDQRIAAKMLANNTLLLDQLAQELILYKQNVGLNGARLAECGSLCKVGFLTTVVGAALSAPVVAVVGAAVVGSLAAEAVMEMLSPKSDALIGEVNQGIEVSFGLGYNRMAYTTELVYDQGNNMISNRVSSLPDTLILEPKEELSLSIQLYKTPLVSEMSRGNYSEVDKLLDKINELREKLDGFYEVPALPEEETKQYAENLEGFSLSVDNQNVTASELTGTTELIKVSFNTSKISDQPFNFNLTYTNEAEETSSFSQAVRLDVNYELVNLSGSGLSSPLEMANSEGYGMKIVDAYGQDMEGFDISKIELQNVSTEDVYLNVQPDGTGNYFEIVPLTDLDMVEVNFDVYYDNEKLQTVHAEVKDNSLKAFLMSKLWYFDGSYLKFEENGILYETERNQEGVFVKDVLTYGIIDETKFWMGDGETIDSYNEILSKSTDYPASFTVSDCYDANFTDCYPGNFTFVEGNCPEGLNCGAD